MRPLLLPLCLLSGCFLRSADRTAAADRDQDGYLAWQVGGEDCDDADPTVHPGAPESCLDDVDSDCDGTLCPERADVFLQPDDAWASGRTNDANLSLFDPPRDHDGDGVAELLLTEVRGDDGAGVVHAVPLPLPPDGLDLSADPTGRVPGIRDGQQWIQGRSPGDLDGDGDAEVLLTTVHNEGVVVVLDHLSPPGEASGDRVLLTDSDHVSTVLGEDARFAIQFGAVQGLGVWTADGRGAFLVGAPGSPGGGEQRGAAWLVVGQPTASGELADVAVAQLQGEQESDAFGGGMSAAADLDGDGRLDPLVNAAGYRPDLPGSPNRSGATGGAFGFVGPLSGVVSALDADVLLTSAYDNARVTAATAIGDVNADGYDDVGMYYGSGAGHYLVFHGPLSGTYFPEAASTQLIGDAGETVTFGFGARSAGAGDLDDDGYDDVVVVATEEGTAGLGDGPVLSGAAYLFVGPLTGVLSPDHARARWMGAYEYGLTSQVLTGDVDGDGTSDLLLGAPSATVPSSGVERGGAVHLLLDAFAGLGG